MIPTFKKGALKFKFALKEAAKSKLSYSKFHTVFIKKSFSPGLTTRGLSWIFMFQSTKWPPSLIVP